MEFLIFLLIVIALIVIIKHAGGLEVSFYPPEKSVATLGNSVPTPAPQGIQGAFDRLDLPREYKYMTESIARVRTVDAEALMDAINSHDGMSCVPSSHSVEKGMAALHIKGLGYDLVKAFTRSGVKRIDLIEKIYHEADS